MPGFATSSLGPIEFVPRRDQCAVEGVMMSEPNPLTTNRTATAISKIPNTLRK
jgi:hypothetical protein